jgi:hypothetical protein
MKGGIVINGAILASETTEPARLQRRVRGAAKCSPVRSTRNYIAYTDRRTA